MAKLSLRRAAAIKLSDLNRVAHALRERGEILSPGPWLLVFANLLSSAPAKWDGDRRGKNAPEYFGLSGAGLSLAARRAGLHVTTVQINTQLEATKAWREKESERLGRPHYVPMASATIGQMLGVTAEVRQAAKAWSIIPYGATREELMEQSHARHKESEFLRKRAKGAVPRETSLSRTQPWKALGICGPYLGIQKSGWHASRAARA